MVAWLLPAAIAASAAISAGANYYGQQQANSANSAMNRGQMQFQWDMAQWQAAQQRQMFDDANAFNQYNANTAFQRGMADMKAAGLNPILAYQQGGASTPQSAGGQIQALSAPGMIPMQNALGPAASSAMQAATAIGGLEQMAASVDQSRANAQFLNEQAKLSQDQQRLAQAHTAQAAAQTVTEGYRSGLVRNQAATEAFNPALRQAETAAQSALAGESGERTRGLEETNRDYRNYGPPGTARDAAVSAERVGRRAAESGATSDFMEGLRTLRERLTPRPVPYSGPRSLPSPPGRQPAGVQGYDFAPAMP